MGALADALVEERRQHRAGVVGRAADDEVVGGSAPGLLQPGNVGLEAAGGEDDAARREVLRPACQARGDAAAKTILQPDPPHLQIGRASCRERVCQYVSISVVAVSLKKKSKQNQINK